MYLPVGNFWSHFFAYYEDSELSRYIVHRQKHSIVYCPKAVVLHEHSTVLGEFSPTWNYLVKRSKLIYLVLRLNSITRKLPLVINKKVQELVIKSLKKYEENAESQKVSGDLINSLQDLDRQFINELVKENASINSRTSIGIYNSYWNTYGGGEDHALNVAAQLRKHFPNKDIYLISESDVDLEHLQSYFGVRITNLFFIKIKNITPDFTKNFWMFVNSTYRSRLESHAEHSLYITSFPFKLSILEKKNWIKSYDYFLCNSQYTRFWTSKLWFNGLRPVKQVIYPILGFESPDDLRVIEKYHSERRKIHRERTRKKAGCHYRIIYSG